ncbi:MAG: tetratricopeptide repeat protein [Candidatus Hydrogenedentota bacterium]|nr:MAG: tetratricopeptide repeat protein [Candidatus Hydrogenedentota bacterium]
MRGSFVMRLSGLLLFLATVLAPAFSEAQPLRVCVADFANLSDTKEDDWLGPFIADSIGNNLKVLPKIEVVGEKRLRGSPIPSYAADASDPRSSLCTMARMANAGFIVGGNFRNEGEKLFVRVYFFLVREEKQIGGTSFVSAIPELYSRLDDLSVSLAWSLDVGYSDEQFTRMRMIPTASLEAMTSYGKALAMPSTSEERGVFLLKAISEDPTYTDALSKLGIYYYETEKFVEACETLERLAEMQPDYPHVYYNLGLVLRPTKQYAKAVDMYRIALSMEPEDSDAWNNLGVTCYLMGMHEDAVEAFRRAIEINPDDLNPQTNLRTVSRGDIEDSPEELHFTSAVDVLKQHIEAGAALYTAGDWWRAIEEFGKALEIQPDNFKAHNNIALAYMKIGETGKAREHLERALEVDPTAIDVRENLARLDHEATPSEISSGMHTTARHLERAQALCTAGRIYLSRRAYEEAADAFARALDVSPDDVDALNGLGIAYIALGEYGKAREQFARTLSLEPENAIAEEKLADVEFILAATEGRPRHEQPFQLSLSPGVEARARCVQAKDLFDAGRYEEAVSEYLRALDFAPTSVEILNDLGNTYLILQRYEQAEAVLKKAHQLDPDNELVSHNLDALAVALGDEKSDEMERLEMVPKSRDTGIEKEAGTEPAISLSAGAEAGSSVRGETSAASGSAEPKSLPRR